MSNPSLPARRKANAQEPDSTSQPTSMPISRLVLDPVMVENAWTTIKRFLPPDAKLRNMDGTDLAGKENVGATAKRGDGKTSVRVGGGKAESDAWGFICRNVERAMLRREQERGVDTSATMTVKAQDQPLGSSNLANQQPSVITPAIRATNTSTAPIPPSDALPPITHKRKTDKTTLEHRRRLVEQWVTGQRERIRDRPGYVESASREVKSGLMREGREDVGVLSVLKEGRRAVGRPATAQRRYPENGEDEGMLHLCSTFSDRRLIASFASSVPAYSSRIQSASPEHISNDTLRSSPRRHIPFDPLADMETVDTISPSGNHEEVDAAAEDESDQAASNLPGPATIEYGVPVAAIGSGSAEGHLENRQVPARSGHTENVGHSKAVPSTTGSPDLGAEIESGNQNDASTQPAAILEKRMSLGSSSTGEVEKSQDGVYLSAEEGEAEVEEGAMSSVSIPGYNPADVVRTSASAATIAKPTTSAVNDIRPEVTSSKAQDRNDSVTERGPKTAPDHEDQAFDPANGGNPDSASAHLATPFMPVTKAVGDRVSTDNLSPTVLVHGGSSTDKREESVRSSASHGQNNAKEDGGKESVSAAFTALETSLNDPLKEKYYFYQSSPTFFLELDPSLSPEERKKLEMQLATWSPGSRIHTATEVLAILQRGSIFKDFDNLESFLKLRYSDHVGVIITLPFADALRYIVRDLYVTREANEQVRQILQEDTTGNHVPAWRLFQESMLKESRAAFVASWADGDASTMQGT